MSLNGAIIYKYVGAFYGVLNIYNSIKMNKIYVSQMPIFPL